MDAAFATSAAPTFFEPLPLCIAGEEEERVLIDGGIFINSPAVSAYASARKRIEEEYTSFSKDNIFVLSLGTGESAAGTEYSEAKDWGAGKWLLELIDYISHSGPAAVHYQMKQFLPPEKYVRLQAKIDEEHNGMDDTSADNICYLENQAKKLIKSCEFENLYEHLKKRANEGCE